MFKISLRVSFFMVALMLCSSSAAFGQGTAFTYQGKLADNGNPANAHYDFQFSLFDDASGGAQQGTTQTVANMLVTNGIFAVTLDFVNCSGCSCPTCFNGGPRFLAIAVRPTGGGSFTPLTERQPITSTPYAVKSMNATNADTATNSTQLGGFAASQYVVTTDPRMTNARTPTAGSTDYIQNSVSTQSASFNIDGDGTVAGNLGVGAISAGSKLNVTGNGIVRLRINSDSNGGLLFALNDQPKWSIATVTGGDLQVFNDASGQLAMSINANTNALTGNGSGLTNVTATTTTYLSLLGSLRWDLLRKQQSFTVGSPTAVAFDGANIWVTNNFSNNVTKLRASDGANLGTFAVGNNPNGAAFDGANIWVANSSGGSVTKLRASDGVTLGTFPAGPSPTGIVFDGANIWVANNISVGTVTKLRASNGANLGSFAVGNTPRGLAFDGANIWVANQLSNNVMKLRASDGSNIGTFAVGITPEFVAFDGTNIWVTNAVSNNVIKLQASDGAVQGTFTVGTGPIGVAFDGTNIWVASPTSHNVTKLRASDGALQGNFSIGTDPDSIAFDGSTIWVGNHTGNNVIKLPVFP